MIILPYNTHLRFTQFPWVTFLIIVLCLVIFLLQMTNEHKIERLVYEYCKDIRSVQSNNKRLDILRQGNCDQVLFYFHQREKHGAFEHIDTFNQKNDIHLSGSEKQKQLELLKKHLEEFRSEAPESFTGKLYYYPDVLNPMRMLASSVAHGGFWHIFYNLIFFLAFAPAIEIIIGRSLTYLSILTGITFITGISYSLYVFMDQSTPIPSLGLSGVVMGVIGLSAYLMPRARIKMFIGIKTFLIPAWIVAIWYIGGDIGTMLSQDSMGGVNLIAHISGGVGGYFLGYIFLKERHEETREELAQEIEDLRFESGRNKVDYLPKKEQRRIRQQSDEKDAKRAHIQLIIKLQKYARNGRDIEGILLLSGDNELYAEDIFSELKIMGHSRLLLCIGRFIINQYIEEKNYAKALYYIEQCQQAVQYFVLANPEHVVLMAHTAMNNHQYQLAFHLVSHAWERHGNYLDLKKCAFLEIDLLIHYLNQEEKSKERVEQLKTIADGQIKQDLIQFEKILYS